MVKSNPDNVWRLVTRKGVTYYVKSPSKSGAKTFLCGMIGISEATPFRETEIHLDTVAPEGYELIQASFRNPADPENWKDGNI